MALFTDWNFSLFLFNVGCSLLASFLFIFLLLKFFRPNIDIVPFIARQDSPFDETDDICHGFKIINKTFFSVYDIVAEANFFTISQGENSVINKVYFKILLNNPHVNMIKRRRLIDKNYGDNCVQFFTYEDILTGLQSGKRCVQFQVTCRHSLTGLSNIKSIEFVKQSLVKNGSFISGNHKGVE